MLFTLVHATLGCVYFTVLFYFVYHFSNICKQDNLHDSRRQLYVL